MMKRFLLIPLLLSGCTAIANWADEAGTHMPVIPEENRCQHWECMSESGKMKSDAEKLAAAKAISNKDSKATFSNADAPAVTPFDADKVAADKTMKDAKKKAAAKAQ